MQVFLIAILAVIVTLMLVVGVHEIGHLLAARFFGVKIQKISIGFGKPLISWQGKTGIQWVYALWPLGGYVKLLNSRIEPVSEEQWPVCFDKKPIWQRILILLAGSILNLLFALLLITIVFRAGLNESVPMVKITENSIAAKAGMQTGDTILWVSGSPVSTWREIGMRLLVSTGNSQVPITVRTQKGDIETLEMDMKHLVLNNNSDSFLTILGLTPDTKAPIVKQSAVSLGEACIQAIIYIKDMIIFYLQILKMLITGVLPFSLLLGPIGFFTLSIWSFGQGVLVFLFFISGFSIAVGLINLFPIPGLDGGSILYALIEKIRAKPLSIATEVLLHRLATIAAVLLFIQLILNDIRKSIE